MNRSTILFLVLLLVLSAPAQLRARNFNVDWDAVVPAGNTCSNYHKVWINYPEYEMQGYTRDQVKYWVAEAYRFWWENSGASIAFEFVEDLAYGSCQTDEDCDDDRYFCDPNTSRCTENWTVQVRSEPRPVEHCWTAGEYDIWGCPHRVNYNVFGDCHRPDASDRDHVEILAHEIGHLYGLRDLNCMSREGYCQNDEDCEGISDNGPTYCRLPDEHAPEGYGCCRYVGDDGRGSIMTCPNPGLELTWKDISTMRARYGQREQPIHTRHYWQGSWQKFTDPPTQTNIGPAIAFNSDENYYCLASAATDTFNSLITHRGYYGTSWDGPYETGSYTTHPPALHYFPDENPGDGSGHFLLVHVGHRKWDVDYQMYYQTSDDCMNWSHWQPLSTDIGLAATSMTRPAIVQSAATEGFVMASHCKADMNYGICSPMRNWNSHRGILQYRYDVNQRTVAPGWPLYDTDTWKILRTKFPFGVGFDPHTQQGLVVGVLGEDASKPVTLCRLYQDPQYSFLGLSLRDCGTLHWPTTEHGVSLVHYPTQDHPWWFAKNPIGSFTPYYHIPLSSWTDVELRVRRIDYDNLHDIEFGPSYGDPSRMGDPHYPERFWGSVGMAYVDFYDEIVIAYPSGTFDVNP